jgi:hypothetical protein
MIRLFALAALTLPSLILPSLAHALCNAGGIETLMTPADRADLNDVAAATPYGQGLYWSAQKDGVELSIIGTMHLAARAPRRTWNAPTYCWSKPRWKTKTPCRFIWRKTPI